MKNNSLNKKASSANLLYKHRKLLFSVTINELTSRYAGSLMGFGWAILSPLLIISVYSVIYLVIFKVKTSSMSSSDYVLYIFSGLVPFLSLSESLAFGVSSVVSNKNVLNNTVFPIDLAPAKAVLLSQPTMLVGFTVILLGTGFTHRLSWTTLLLPIVWGLQIMGVIGLNWILSLVTVVFRDMQSLITIVIMVLMVASPIAYTPEMVSGLIKIIIYVNPFAYFVITYQRILVLGQLPDLITSLGVIVSSVGLFILGNWLFSQGKATVIDYV
jgi:lipopolysaccharide transport system permease protein